MNTLSVVLLWVQRWRLNGNRIHRCYKLRVAFIFYWTICSFCENIILCQYSNSWLSVELLIAVRLYAERIGEVKGLNSTISEINSLNMMNSSIQSWYQGEIYYWKNWKYWKRGWKWFSSLWKSAELVRRKDGLLIIGLTSIEKRFSVVMK